MLSWARCWTCTEGFGYGAHPADEAKGTSEVLWRSLPAGHGAIPFYRILADSREARQVLKYLLCNPQTHNLENIVEGSVSAAVLMLTEEALQCLNSSSKLSQTLGSRGTRHLRKSVRLSAPCMRKCKALKYIWNSTFLCSWRVHPYLYRYGWRWPLLSTGVSKPGILTWQEVPQKNLKRADGKLSVVFQNSSQVVAISTVYVTYRVCD